MLNSQAAGLRGRDGIMTSSENYRANREAISDVAARSGGVGALSARPASPAGIAERPAIAPRDGADVNLA